MESDLVVNGVRLHYRIDGQPEGAPTVVLSNSLATDLGMWDDLIPALADRYRILRYDKRGHGQSDAKDAAIEIRSLADDAVALADALGFSGGHFVGLSIGGMTGQAIGLYHRDAFRTLVLCATSSQIPADLHPVWEGRIRTVREQGMEPMVEPTVERWFTPEGRESQAATVDRVKEMIRRTSPTGYISCCEAIVGMSYTDLLHRIETPTLVVPGEKDPALPVAMSQAIAERIPGARMEVVENAAHLCNIENPRRFNAILRSWLDEQEAARAA